MPVLLSVGYAACHWCHVMAHESFEDDATAAYLNEHFVSIKVDREERPDVDAVYMDATTSMTGHGGWPMTCVLDHDGNPFFAGTYFPDQPRHGQPSFRQVLEALTDAWQTKPEDVRRVAGNAARAPGPGHGAWPARRDHRGDAGRRGRAAAAGVRRRSTAASAARRSSRRRWCSSSCCARRGERAEMLPTRPWRRWRAAGSTTSSAAASRATPSTRSGWCRTSRRCSTTTPSCSASTRGRAARWASGSPRETADFMIRELRHRRGRLRLRARRRQRGRGGQVLRLDPGRAGRGARAGRRRLGRAGLRGHRGRHLRARLLHPPAAGGPGGSGRRRGWPTYAAGCSRRRAQRVRPALDDKVVAAWNGLAITGLCDAGLRLGEPRVRRRGGRRR